MSGAALVFDLSMPPPPPSITTLTNYLETSIRNLEESLDGDRDGNPEDLNRSLLPHLMQGQLEKDIAIRNVEVWRYHKRIKDVQEDENISMLCLNINSLLKAKNVRVNNFQCNNPLGIKINQYLLRDINRHSIIALSDVRLKTEDQEEIYSAFQKFIISGCFNNQSSKREFEGSLILVNKNLVKNTIEKGSFRVNLFTPYIMSYLAYTSHTDTKFLIISLYLPPRCRCVFETINKIRDLFAKIKPNKIAILVDVNLDFDKNDNWL